MAKRSRAPEQFERITYLLPHAAREGGALLDELAELLDVSMDQLVRDLHEVTTRSHYHPAGSVDEFRLSVDSQRISVWTTGEFRRPTRLSAREALALALGLRIVAQESDPARREELTALAHRLDTELASAPASALAPRYGFEEVDGAAGILAQLREAARERRRCRIEYLKSGSPGPETREICPYVLIYAEGNWYTLAHCLEREAVRAFRFDRIFSVQLAEGTFEVPSDFDPRDHLADGRLYRAEDEIEVTIRYSPAIARWIEEREPEVTAEPDGSVVLRHRVADPRWIVGHVLQYGLDAEVLAPAEIRRLVSSTLRRMSEALDWR